MHTTLVMMLVVSNEYNFVTTKDCSLRFSTVSSTCVAEKKDLVV